MTNARPQHPGGQARHRAPGQDHEPGVVGDLVRESSRGKIGESRRILATLRQISREPGCMISRRYRFVWISNEKVGSRSLIAALFGVDPDAEWTTNTSIADIHAMYPETRNYFSFAFIRNPFDRAISFHSHLHHFRNVPFLHGGMEHRRHYFSRYHGPAETRHFDAYCEWLNSPYGSDQYESDAAEKIRKKSKYNNNNNFLFIQLTHNPETH